MSAFEHAVNNATIRPVKSQPPFLGAGEHTLDLMDLYEAKDRKSGQPVVWAEFKVRESNLHPIGSEVVIRYQITKVEQYADNPTQIDLLLAMFSALTGTTDITKARVKMVAVVKSPAKPARGFRVRCSGRPNSKGTWVNRTWYNVEQTKEQVAAQRAALDAEAPVETAAPAPAPVAAPAPTLAPSGDSIDLDALLG